MVVSISGYRAYLKYSEWANSRLIAASSPLSDGQLDQPFDMGRGTLRLTLMHIWAGEHVWLQRWRGQAETPWPDEDERLSPGVIGDRLQGVYVERASFLEAISEEHLSREITYRDSRGSLFSAVLSDMLMQGMVHSIHHRAQGANMIRRAGGESVDLDYMYWRRKPAGP